MRRIDTPNAVATKPAATATGTPGFFFDGDPLTGQPGTELSAEWLNQVQELLRTPIVSAGYASPTRTQVDYLELAIKYFAAQAVATHVGQADPHNQYVRESQLDALIDARLLVKRPVGSIELRYDATSPADIFGGTWVLFGGGRVLVGLDPDDEAFDAVGDTGGERTHTLTIDEIPAHWHQVGNYSGIDGSLLEIGQQDQSEPWEDTTPKSSIGTSTTGGGQAHNNMQPYIVVRFWRRTA